MIFVQFRFKLSKLDLLHLLQQSLLPVQSLLLLRLMLQQSLQLIQPTDVARKTTNPVMRHGVEITNQRVCHADLQETKFGFTTAEWELEHVSLVTVIVPTM